MDLKEDDTDLEADDHPVEMVQQNIEKYFGCSHGVMFVDEEDFCYRCTKLGITWNIVQPGELPDTLKLRHAGTYLEHLQDFENIDELFSIDKRNIPVIRRRQWNRDNVIRGFRRYTEGAYDERDLNTLWTDFYYAEITGSTKQPNPKTLVKWWRKGWCR
jgi:hypothetical protein